MKTFKRSKTFFLILFIFIGLFFGCRLAYDGALVDESGNVIVPTQEEIQKNQKMLLNIKSSKDLPESAEGSVVFDGTVYSVKESINGMTITRFKINRVIFGDKDEISNITKAGHIDIFSPSVKRGGVSFIIGSEYRVLTVYLNNEYRTWSTGAVKLQD